VTVYKTDERGFIATIVCKPRAGQGENWAKIIQDLGSSWTLEDLIMELEGERILHGYGDLPRGVGVVVEQAIKGLQAEH
jgi:hypothetical protein